MAIKYNRYLVTPIFANETRNIGSVQTFPRTDSMPEELSIETNCRLVFQNVRRHFIWASDKVVYGQPDHWQDFTKRVRAGITTRADCEDFALTCLDFLRETVPPDKLKICFCITETGGGHAVAAIDDDPAGKTWVLDNRERDIADWRSLRYRWVSFMKLSERGVWRKFD